MITINHSYYVYIITNYEKTVLYTGVTNSIEIRIIEHYTNRGKPETFAGRYSCFYLLYYECHKYINDAIAREKEIKGKKREKKIALIKELNPAIKFLNKELFGVWPPKDIKLFLRSNN
jgi:putative endonuclease